MSIDLRDYFAGKALQALLSCPDFDGGMDVHAARSYDMADAMLKARGKDETPYREIAPGTMAALNELLDIRK